jgi:hypothetical protein
LIYSETLIDHTCHIRIKWIFWLYETQICLSNYLVVMELKEWRQ